MCRILSRNLEALGDRQTRGRVRAYLCTIHTRASAGKSRRIGHVLDKHSSRHGHDMVSGTLHYLLTNLVLQIETLAFILYVSLSRSSPLFPFSLQTQENFCTCLNNASLPASSLRHSPSLSMSLAMQANELNHYLAEGRPTRHQNDVQACLANARPIDPNCFSVRPSFNIPKLPSFLSFLSFKTVELIA